MAESIFRQTDLKPSGVGLQPRSVSSPLAQRHTLNTFDEDNVPRYYFTPRYSSSSTLTTFSYGPNIASPTESEDFPTPKAHLFNLMSSSTGAAAVNLMAPPQPSSHRVSRADSDFDSLYDITDDEAEVPLKISASVKKTIARNPNSPRSRYPSLIIPSPSAWPTIEKLKSAMSSVPPTPAQLLSPSANALSSIASRNLQVPATSATPSLDGSLTSEEMDRMSCPSTPDISNPKPMDGDDWSGPMQLDVEALETLEHLRSLTDLQRPVSQEVTQVIEIPPGEMQEVARPSLALNIPQSIFTNSSSVTPVSALSIPSPGGFFSSLESNARHTWSMPNMVEESGPNTSTAEKFYQLPWKPEPRRNTIAEQTVTLDGSTLDGFSIGAPTPRAIVNGGEDDLEIKEINPSKTIFQYNENYHVELKKLAAASQERTGDWLREQDELQAALREMSDMSPTTSASSHSRGNSLDKTKKSVRFQEDPPKSPEESVSPKKITTYLQGWEFVQHVSKKNDAYIHRQTRAEAIHIQRRCLPQAHRDQLLGKFELKNPVRPAPPRPVSEFYTDDPTVLKERIARAQTERQALDQILPINWVLQALKHLHGGKLLGRNSSRLVSRARTPRILDVGGVACNDWAWQVAYDYPYATVTTVYTAGNNLTVNVSGPDNHKATQVPNLWTFPFPSGHFDVISARTLHELLKTDKPLGRTLDEYDLCLKECFRCLKPGGLLEFSLLDADIIHGGERAHAMGVEFGFNLKTRGYDAAPTKSFLPRLTKAGFREVQRAWMVLPMGKPAAGWKDVLPVGAAMENKEERVISADGDVDVASPPVWGSTADVSMLTGIVGAWQWERWLLRLQMEMGKDEERLLEGVVQVLEEGARDGAAWRVLKGVAKKQK